MSTFPCPIQQAIYRTVLSLGENAYEVRIYWQVKEYTGATRPQFEAAMQALRTQGRLHSGLRNFGHIKPGPAPTR